MQEFAGIREAGIIGSAGNGVAITNTGDDGAKAIAHAGMMPTTLIANWFYLVHAMSFWVHASKEKN